MISILLMEKIISLCLILAAGFVLVKMKCLKGEDSKVLSRIALYLAMPCNILSAFQVDFTEQVRDGLFLAFAAAILIHIGLFILFWIFKFLFHLDGVESVSAMYSNSGNLIIPLVYAILGPEWVIYTSAFIAVQLFLLFSHGKAILCGNHKFDIREIITNINMISIFFGVILLLTGLRFPAPVQDAVKSLGDMVGPIAMLVTGMLIGEMQFSKFTQYRRVWLITILRLLAVPFLTVIFLKYSGMAGLVENGREILLVTLLATMTPSASTVTQMAQVYGQDADYASVINVITTLLCIITMPVMVFIYQL
ncbi:MAG: AEC family transporter [Lachnospiraceae bacterium]|nr:AEC family transporter [Lachnospiraceae bacterium]